MERTSKHFRKRDAILQCVRSTATHPSADWVFEHVRSDVPDISLATVYRNLALFKDQGLIASLGTVKGVERFDGNTAPHVHFVCTGCGATISPDADYMLCDACIARIKSGEPSKDGADA